MQRILVLGAGFSGLWAAVGAARRLDELGVGDDAIEIVVVNRTPWHCIRVRNYEADVTPARVRLETVLDPIGVKLLVGEVHRIDTAARRVTTMVDGKARELTYDRLVFALGSHLVRPTLPGADTFLFDIDTFEAATRLEDHIAALTERERGAGRFTAVVVGAGLTGIEAACELPDRLRRVMERAAAPAGPARVVLVDHNAWIGSDMGAEARPVIAEALRALGVETRTGVAVTAVDAGGVMLSSGERIEAATVVWCAGMRSNPLTALFGADLDRSGRLPVDDFLKIKGATAEFATGDSAVLAIDGVHASVMSCQHSRPMGRYTGYNVASDLLGQPMLPLRVDYYVTVLDLGPHGAVYTEGWDRHVVSTGAAAKQTKQTINRQRIYPPTNGERRAILDAAAPAVQAPPPRQPGDHAPTA